MDLIARDGTRVELAGEWSTRELRLTLTLAAPTDCACDCGGCEHHGDEYEELELDRAQVVELRDQLGAWLERGQPS